MFLQGIILPMTKSDQQHITQHKRFVPYGTHPNFCFTKTSFMLSPIESNTLRLTVFPFKISEIWRGFKWDLELLQVVEDAA